MNPSALTLLGLLVALAAPVLAAAGDRWTLLAVVAVAVSGLLDGLDGAVALIAGRASRWGGVLDACCDRVADSGYVLALWALGAPGWLCVGAAGVALLHEYVRARAGAAGMLEVGVVTVAERPTRVIIAAMFLLGAGVYPFAAADWALAGGAAWLGVGLVGLTQLVVVVRRRLR